MIIGNGMVEFIRPFSSVNPRRSRGSGMVILVAPSSSPGIVLLWLQYKLFKAKNKLGRFSNSPNLQRLLRLEEKVWRAERMAVGNQNSRYLMELGETDARSWQKAQIAVRFPFLEGRFYRQHAEKRAYMGSQSRLVLGSYACCVSFLVFAETPDFSCR